MEFSGTASMLGIAAEMSLSEKGISSAKVVLTGFVVVFIMLILLIITIKVYSKIIVKAQKSFKNRKKKVKDVEIVKPKAETAADKIPADSHLPADGVSDEIVAVISAAVSSVYGPKEKIKIKSIKKADAGRSSWANAGLLNNTRPF